MHMCMCMQLCKYLFLAVYYVNNGDDDVYLKMITTKVS
jgi:coproporphyrinogen III oxidase-like Fe-S oxidoreductase